MLKRKSFIGGIAAIAVCAAVLGACSPKEKSAAVEIGYSVPDTTNPFLGWLTTEVKKLAVADGKTLEIADAGNNVAKQMEQIENFMAMKVKVINIMPIDPNNVQEIIQRAQKQGIKVLVAGSDTTYYDVMMNMDQYNCGEQIAEMGIEWIIKTYSKDGTAAGLPTGDKKPKILVIQSTDTVDSKKRSQGIIDKINAWGKATVVISPTEARSTASATAVMENLWQQNSDAAAVLTYNADAAMGVNEYIMGQAKVNKARFGIFSGDWSPPVQETINASLAGKSVYRGTMQIVGPQLNNQPTPLEQATYTLLKDLSEGKRSYGKWIKDSIQKAYPKAS